MYVAIATEFGAHSVVDVGCGTGEFVVIARPSSPVPGGVGGIDIVGHPEDLDEPGELTDVGVTASDANDTTPVTADQQRNPACRPDPESLDVDAHLEPDQLRLAARLARSRRSTAVSKPTA